MEKCSLTNSTNHDWQGSVHSLKERLDYLHRNQVFSDIIFLVGSEKPQKVPCHKLIMSMCSNVFEAMFFGPMANHSEMEIKVPDVEPEEWKTMLRYMYTEEIKLTSTSHAIKTAYAAKKYMLQGLHDGCMSFLSNNMTVSTVCQIYEASYYLDNQRLERDSLQMIIQNAEEVVSAQTPEVLTAFMLKKLVRQQFLPYLKECTLFRKMVDWLEHSSTENMRQQLEKFLPYVRFLTMDPADFITACAKSRLLTDTEVVSIACNLAVPGSRPLPIWCSSDKSNRIGQKPFLCVLSCSGEATFRESNTIKLKCHFEVVEGCFLLHGVEFNRLLRANVTNATQVGLFNVPDATKIEVQFDNKTKDVTNIFAIDCKGDEMCSFPTPELVMQGDTCSIEVTLQNPPRYYGREDVYKDAEVRVKDLTIRLLNDEPEGEKCAKLTGLYISLLE